VAKFRKKPVVIEAFHWSGESAAVNDLMQWAMALPNKKSVESLVSTKGPTLTIRTLEGDHTASPGDWIICGIKGELYPCKPDIFEAMYEPADAAERGVRCECPMCEHHTSAREINRPRYNDAWHPRVAAALGQCCERDYDRDGNCDRHEAPGVPRVEGAARVVVDQPPPRAKADRRTAWGLVIDDYKRLAASDGLPLKVIDDMLQRDRIGRERYGMPLTSGNGRKHLVDAYQEALDFAVYLRAWIDEQLIQSDHPFARLYPRADMTSSMRTVEDLYAQALRAIATLRSQLQYTEVIA
jgi:hypothetical protein